MDDEIDLSADVPGDASAYVSDALDSTGSAVAVASEATNQIQSTLGMIGRGVTSLSGVLGNYGIKLGAASNPTAVRSVAVPGAPPPVQVGSTMQSANSSVILYIVLAVVALVAMVWALS